MRIEQLVMAYGVVQDRLRAMLPDGFSPLRPVLRINAGQRNISDIRGQSDLPSRHKRKATHINRKETKSNETRNRYRRNQDKRRNF